MDLPCSAARLALRLLVIDDNRDDLELLQQHLRGIRSTVVEVVCCQDLESALKELEGGSFDLVLTDYDLGEETGLDLLTRVRQKGLDLPMILLTDKGDEMIAVRSLQAGMADYLPKCAVSASSLRRAIENAHEKAMLRGDIALEQQRVSQALTELRARNEEIQSFYHTLSHELKTPLTAAREFVSILHDGLQGPLNEDQHASLTRTLACCDQMRRLLDDILDCTRLETGKLQLEARVGSLLALADQAVAHCKPLADKRQVRLQIQQQKGVDKAWFDPERLLQVLTNLLNNAIKYSPAGSVVQLRLEAPRDNPDEVRVAVVDRGRGIPHEQHRRIFERLYQVDKCDTAIHGGLGLGLYLCREILRLHGQEIEIESEVDKGSTFAFRLGKAKPTSRKGVKSRRVQP